MKVIMTLSCMAWLLPTMAAGNGNPKKDTVIIELNNNSKIIIYTKTKADLAALQQYDINKLIRELNDQLTDSVTYLEIQKNEEETVLKEKYSEEEDHEQINIDLGSMSIKINPNEMEDFDEEDWENRKKSSYDVDRAKDRTTNHFNVDLGVNNWIEDGNFPDVNNAPYSVKPFGSWYLALNSINSTWITGPLFLEWGLGVSWYSWKLQDADYRIEKGDERIILTENPDQDGLKSKLTASYINFQLVPMFDFSKGRRKLTNIESEGIRIKKYSRKGIRIGAGVYAGYRLGSHTKFKFSEEGSIEKEREKENYFLENFRYGIRGQVGWKGLEFFGMYDLNTVFSANRGPEGSPGLNAISFGVIL